MATALSSIESGLLSISIFNPASDQAQTGPDLTHFASRPTMLAGMMPTTEDNLREWLSDPQLVKPGAHMPRFIFEKDSINVLVAYISGLK